MEKTAADLIINLFGAILNFEEAEKNKNSWPTNLVYIKVFEEKKKLLEEAKKAVNERFK